MARTVGLTAALGMRLLLSAEGRAALGGGVHLPASPSVYRQVLPLLAAEGVHFDAERCRAVPSAGAGAPEGRRADERGG